MTEKSSYLRYLPPVLWGQEEPLPAFSLGAMLRIFEKILTGIDDDAILSHGNHTHNAIEAVIARIPYLFNPWYTPPEVWTGSHPGWISHSHRCMILCKVRRFRLE